MVGSGGKVGEGGIGVCVGIGAWVVFTGVLVKAGACVGSSGVSEGFGLLVRVGWGITGSSKVGDGVRVGKASV